MVPKDGNAGIPVAASAPKSPHEADKADPGEMTEIKARQRELKAGKYGSTPSKPFKPPTAAAAGAQTAAEKEKEKKKTWIAIKLTRSDGSPGAGEPYEIGMEGQVLASGTLDEKGEARVDGLDPQTCKVSFPNLDKSAWKPQ